VTPSERAASAAAMPTPEAGRRHAGGLILHSGGFGSKRVTLLGLRGSR
jgi:hypothetical protein